MDIITYETITGNCPIQKCECTIEIRIKKFKSLGQTDYNKIFSVKSCEYHETNKCEMIMECPIVMELYK